MSLGVAPLVLASRRAPSLLVGDLVSLCLLGPLAGSYRSRVRDVVILVGRSAGLRMCER
jgi:hypothetical protein